MVEPQKKKLAKNKNTIMTVGLVTSEQETPIKVKETQEMMKTSQSNQTLRELNNSMIQPTILGNFKN